MGRWVRWFQRQDQQFQAAVEPLLERLQINVEWKLMMSAVVIGVIGGFGAIVFHKAIHWMGEFSKWAAGFLTTSTATEGSAYHYFADLPWWMKILIPVVGAAIVGPVTHFLARDAKGHGVPEVMDAVARRGGVIRARVAIVKIITSAISIGTGSSLGPEGPVAQIGATFGSVNGQLLRVGPDQMRYMVACGAAAGIAATFNAPIAGMFFAMEIILSDFAITALSGLAIASVTATVVSRTYLGATSAFVTPPDFILNTPVELPVYAVLGLAAGVVAVAYKKMLYATEDVFIGLKRFIPEAAQPMIGAVLVGLIGIWVPNVFGVGYDTIDGIHTADFSATFLLVIVVAKMLATSLSLGSGSSGGVFAPSLVMGSALGGAVGLFASNWLPFINFAPSGTYAVVGMAAVVAATAHAPLTAMLIVFEMTDGYEIILPLMIATSIATIFARLLSRESIYTLKLVRSGVVLAGGREESVLTSKHVSDVMLTDIETIPRNTPFQKIVDAMLEHDHTEFYVTDDELRLVGRINLHMMKSILAEPGLNQLIMAEDVMLPHPPFVTPDQTLADCLRRLSLKSMDEVAVVESEKSMRLVGVLPRSAIIDTYHREVVRQSAVGLRVVQHTSGRDRLSHVEYAEGFGTREIRVGGAMTGQTLVDLDLRARYRINCLAVKPAYSAGPGESDVPDPKRPLEEGDRLICAGPTDALEAFARDNRGE